jgi:hypothetical protein
MLVRTKAKRIMIIHELLAVYAFIIYRVLLLLLFKMLQMQHAR